jgi:hypothetical protein
VAEWSKALAWKVSIRQNRIEGSNPSRSAIQFQIWLPRCLDQGGGAGSRIFSHMPVPEPPCGPGTFGRFLAGPTFDQSAAAALDNS